jgi:hypothetical protein
MNLTSEGDKTVILMFIVEGSINISSAFLGNLAPTGN